MFAGLKKLFLGLKFPGIEFNTSQNIITVSPFNLELILAYKYVFNISHLGFTEDGINLHMSQKSYKSENH